MKKSILNLAEGSSGINVSLLHMKLKFLGYNIDKIEIQRKEFGSSTKSAIRDFQRKHGLKEVGKTDSLTTSKLNDIISKQDKRQFD